MKRFGIPLLLVVFGTAGACSQSTAPASPSVATAGSSSDSLAAKSGRMADTPATSDLGASGGSFQVSSDSATDLVYNNGVSGVSSIIQTSNTCCNDWIINTSSTRGIFVSFATKVSSGANGSAPFTSQVVYGAGIIAQCHDQYLPSFPGMTLNQQVNCSGNVHFASGRNTFRVVMGDLAHRSPDFMSVTCNAVDAQGCKEWTVVPSNSSGQNLVDLQLWDGSKFLGEYGTYLMAFNFHVTRP